MPDRPRSPTVDHRPPGISVQPTDFLCKPPLLCKAWWAAQHYSTLTTAFHAFVSEANKHVTEAIEHDRGQEWTVFRWGDHPAPQMMGLVLGDMVHNLRAALDYVCASLAIDNQSDNWKRTQFPICDSAATWRQRVTERPPEDGPSPVEGVHPDKIALIEKAQPYDAATSKERSGHPLLKLLHLSNADKHRALHVATVTAGSPDIVRYDPEGFYEPIGLQTPKEGTVIEAGAEIVRFRRRVIAEPPPHTEVHVRVSGGTEVAFGPKGKPPIATYSDLASIHQVVKETAYRIRPWAVPPGSDLADIEP